ncbi:vacuolar import and degradation protein [Verticillium alfalfae VaMs.102]|uniref:Vacuolar import and degradation protein n=1 Tax=Verticillium alfalfae (strain VaMs.102 / ATCC MYA-4576 / FGSC 10136) TaxID=526221 RepID=C9SD06_VERA1|nr:vacuolar import and degradation protein [Verticillium alfalfae VaMs.102]EEY16971.1 vacuolar import and degradation protein [Verticillium alfalfae VaMs.102]
MFVLRNVGKLIFGSTSQESLIELPQGQLYLVRPLSPKGYSELIFKDATAQIRRTGQDFQYQLVIQRVYEEGEAELLLKKKGRTPRLTRCLLNETRRHFCSTKPSTSASRFVKGPRSLPPTAPRTRGSFASRINLPLERFQEGLLRCLWEQLNETKWEKIKEREQEYVTDAFNDLQMEDTPEEEEEEEEEAEEPEYEDADPGQQSEHYDSDEEDEDVVTKDEDGNVNSQLAVGYKHDRSFVVRGSKIGVFKHTNNDKLEFSTNISKVETPNGVLFSPKKVMLHNEDRNMILQHQTDPNKLYRMDLEYGKVVDEWNVHEDIPVVTFAPENKYAQMTHEPTFLGVSHNALYRIDPRLSGDKLVESQLKQYASKNQFSAMATTEKGHIAVASNKGDVRLFDRLGINAKTHIPALGEAIIGLDVSADGRWVLATCNTYILLIDAMQKTGKNEGKLGFEKPFAAADKPQPRRLALTPEHVAQFSHETGKPVRFTPARFNAGEGVEETSIITATGPYIIEWNLKKVLRGAKAPYLIKRYTEDVKADDFQFGTDKNVIVALPNEVNMIGKGGLKRPTRESIAGDFTRLSVPGGRKSSGRIGTPRSGRYKLGRDEVVNSPY